MYFNFISKKSKNKNTDKSNGDSGKKTHFMQQCHYSADFPENVYLYNIYKITLKYINFCQVLYVENTY